MACPTESIRLRLRPRALCLDRRRGRAHGPMARVRPSVAGQTEDRGPLTANLLPTPRPSACDNRRLLSVSFSVHPLPGGVPPCSDTPKKFRQSAVEIEQKQMNENKRRRVFGHTCANIRVTGV